VSLTGVFLDSAVAGIGYRTETKSGFTNSLGEYDYLEGETVTFFIGDLELPPVAAKGVITPLDLAGTDELTDQVVLNISILLQSLDSDNDPSNGITIDYDTIESTATAVDFDQPANDFSTAITGLATAAGNTVVSVADAQEHLEQTLTNLDQLNAKRLIGTWYIRQQDGDDDYHIVVAFLDETRYMSIDIDNATEGGLEVGTYKWDVDSGLISVEIDAQTDGDLGFSGGTYRIQVAGDQLLMSEDGTGEDPVPMVKLASDNTNAVVGGWYIHEAGTNAMVAFTDTHYLMAQYTYPVEDPNGVSGVEFGTYTYNSTSKEVRFATLFDTNEQWGFSHACAIVGVGEDVLNELSCGPNGAEVLQTLEYSGDNKLIFTSEADTIANDGEEQPNTFFKVGTPAEHEEIVLPLNVTNTVTSVNPGELFTVEGATMQCNWNDPVGTVENFNETWTLKPNYGEVSTLVGDDMEITDLGIYDLAFGKLRVTVNQPKINLCETEITCNNGTVFYQQTSYSWVADVDTDLMADVSATGQIVETVKLSWNRDSNVSVCTIHYDTSAQLATATNNAAISGAWNIGDDYFIFRPNGTMSHVKAANEDPNCKVGFAHGTYTWNSDTSAFSVNLSIDNTAIDANDSCSLVGITEISVDGDTLTATENGDTFILNKISASESAPLAGAWRYGNSDLFVFTEDNQFTHAKVANDDPNCQIGMATGTYSFNAETGAFTSAVLQDSTDTFEDNHCSIGSAFTVENAGSSLFFSDSEESFSLYKIGE
jgi:hypothetical protein